MTHETVTLPGVSDDEHRTVNLLLEQLDAKARRNRLRSAYYDMRHAPRLIGSVIPPQYWRAGIVLGWSGKAVDTLARRCNLDGFVWPDGDLESLGYGEFADDNMLGSEVSQGLISSLIHAVAFVVNTQGLDGEPSSLLHFKDAMNATGEWNARARRLESFLSVTSRGQRAGREDCPTGLALYLDGLTITAEVVEGKWVVTGRQEHAWAVPADPLVYKPRVDRPFGSSRISRAVRPRTAQSLELALRAGWLTVNEACLYDLAEVPALYESARKVAARGGLPGDLRAEMHRPAAPAILLRWTVLSADRDGRPTCRVATLPIARSASWTDRHWR